MNITTVVGLIGMLSTSPEVDFSEYLKSTSYYEQYFAKVNNINDWNSYIKYHKSREIREKKNTSGDEIIDLMVYLNNKYSNYYWIRDDEKCALTSDVSNAIPVEVGIENIYDEHEFDIGINKAGLSDFTSYGGCGPIATIGILDYFSRYLGYKEIIKNPNNAEERIELITEVLNKTKFLSSSTYNSTGVSPFNYEDTFEKILKIRNLKNIINVSNHVTLFGSKLEKNWDLVVENINKGLPVTLCTGENGGEGAFSNHYTNIYGYETWKGMPRNGEEILTKRFIKARLNYGQFQEFYCDANILDIGLMSLITYDVNYNNSYQFKALDFAEEFVNTKGQGEYFFQEKSSSVNLINGLVLDTKRLRTSYIENKYLVLSPYRKNAGTAYLDITFPTSVSKMTYTSSMWSSKEGANLEKFKIQYYEDNEWKDHIEVKLNELTTLRDYQENFTLLFPKNVNRIRFYATYPNRIEETNKGRICLDNFVVEYNE